MTPSSTSAARARAVAIRSRNRAAVLRALHAPTTPRRMAGRLPLHWTTILAHLRALAALGVVIRTGRGPATRWQRVAP